MGIIDRTLLLVKKLTNAGISLAIAESCTGGYISNMITNVPGASKIFNRGIICYSNESKIELLNINPRTLKIEGAVSKAVAYQLAKNIRILSNTKLGISTTGIAGPTGGTREKPVGLVYIGFSNEINTQVEKHQLITDRLTFKEKVFEIVLLRLEELMI